MRLLRVYQTGFGVQSFAVAGFKGQQCFNVDEGAGLLVIDAIVDLAVGQLTFAEDGSAAPAPTRHPSPTVEALLAMWD